MFLSFSSPFFVSDINIKSSAKNIADMFIPLTIPGFPLPIVVPIFELHKSSLRSFKYKANNKGDKLHPCLTPWFR